MDAFVRRSAPATQAPRGDGEALDFVAVDRPSKRVRVEREESRDSQDEDADGVPESVEVSAFMEEPAPESSLPPVKSDAEAIQEYEAMRASQGDTGGKTAESSVDSRAWVKGRSSIYVDAFNLALDTVLEDESHLFNEAEKAVFEYWRHLDYEAQYLCGSLSLLVLREPG